MLPIHTTIGGYTVRDDCLEVDGHSLHDLVRRAGQTPFYLYSKALVSQRIAELRRQLPASIQLHYAIKANSLPALVNHIAPQVNGLDVASGRELATALASGMDPREISFAGPGKSVSELEAAVEAGVLVNVESMTELRRLAAAGQRLGKTPRYAIRVNPDFELKSSGMKMSGGPKQFGIDAEQVPGVLAEAAGMPLDFWGFHVFSGSQNLRSDSIVESQQKAVALVQELAVAAPRPPRFINVGGGFGIPYFPGELPLDVAPIGTNLTALCADVAARWPGAGLVIELGRYLVGEAGIYVARVVDRKVSRGKVFLVTDGGLHHHLAASGNFGQVLRKNYPVVVGNRVQGAERERASVVGPLCTPLDLLADNMDLARAEVDDLIVVFQSGAYGLSASPTAFLSHPAPVELLI
jgi:diaminopimelate decarboxylase